VGSRIEPLLPIAIVKEESSCMHKITAARTTVSAFLIGLTLPLMLTAADAPSWNRKAAAGALDERQTWGRS
jgi:hypothetical protein